MRILAIHAHPDDVEFLGGGTVVLLAAQGHDITIATMTPGDCGAKGVEPDEIAAIRRREAKSSAALIGAKYVCAEFRDCAVFNDDPSRRRVTELLRRTQPELVLTASPIDYMPDHEAASSLVRDCCFIAPAPNYRTGVPNAAPPLEKIPTLYFMDPSAGVDREDRVVIPDFVADVNSTFARKQRMLAQHRSQREWLAAHHGVDDYLGMMERWTRARGALAGIEFGEGFRLYRGHAYPNSPVLEDLLGDEVVRRPLA
ncbi:MAG TPA: PIG-L family deacetylase [Bryobacteraceae bacterium]|nr:PIG-L family deacetylase [Bryobacteraceae bacterium]